MNILVNRATAHVVTFIFGFMLLAGLLAPWSLAVADIAAQLEQAEQALGAKAFGDAHDLFLPLAQDGSPDAMMGLYQLYANGWGVEQNDAKAAEWAAKARKVWETKAKNNDPHAYKALGFLFYKGLGVAKDRGRARAYFGKAYKLAISLGMAGDADAQYLIGLFYTSGRYLQKDPLKGVAWLEAAGNNGHRKAMRLLAFIYDCQCRGIPRDNEKAEYWRTKLNAP